MAWLQQSVLHLLSAFLSKVMQKTQAVAFHWPSLRLTPCSAVQLALAACAPSGHVYNCFLEMGSESPHLYVTCVLFTECNTMSHPANKMVSTAAVTAS
jgi:hypothetical protein